MTKSILFLLALLVAGINPAYASSFQVPTGTQFTGAYIVAPAGYLLSYGQAVSRTTYVALFNATTIQITGTVTSSSACVSSPSSTANMTVGMPVSGTAIPTSTVIAGLPGTCSSGQIQLSANATASHTAEAIVVAPQGVGDGATTFNTPDCRGHVMAGLDNLGGTSAGRLTNAGLGGSYSGTLLGNAGGQDHLTLSASQSGLPAHTHSITDPGHTHENGMFTNNGAPTFGGNVSQGSGYPSNSPGNYAVYYNTTGITVNTVSAVAASSAHSTTMPVLVENCIIKF